MEKRDRCCVMKQEYTPPPSPQVQQVCLCGVVAQIGAGLLETYPWCLRFVSDVPPVPRRRRRRWCAASSFRSWQAGSSLRSSRPLWLAVPERGRQHGEIISTRAGAVKPALAPVSHQRAPVFKDSIFLTFNNQLAIKTKTTRKKELEGHNIALFSQLIKQLKFLVKKVYIMLYKHLYQIISKYIFLGLNNIIMMVEP